MVEPQEPKISQQILARASVSGSEINQLCTSLPAEILADSDKKVEGFTLLKA